MSTNEKYDDETVISVLILVEPWELSKLELLRNTIIVPKSSKFPKYFVKFLDCDIYPCTPQLSRYLGPRPKNYTLQHWDNKIKQKPFPKIIFPKNRKMIMIKLTYHFWHYFVSGRASISNIAVPVNGHEQRRWIRSVVMHSDQRWHSNNVLLVAERSTRYKFVSHYTQCGSSDKVNGMHPKQTQCTFKLASSA